MKQTSLKYLITALILLTSALGTSPAIADFHSCYKNAKNFDEQQICYDNKTDDEAFQSFDEIDSDMFYNCVEDSTSKEQMDSCFVEFQVYEIDCYELGECEMEESSHE